jgi:hypothetical protein
MHVTFMIGMGMMPSVIDHPTQDATLKTHGGERTQQELQSRGRLVAPVRKVSVHPQANANAHKRIEDEEDTEVDPSYALLRNPGDCEKTSNERNSDKERVFDTLDPDGPSSPKNASYSGVAFHVNVPTRNLDSTQSQKPKQLKAYNQLFFAYDTK